jgi:hypothetical protein
VKSLRGKKDSFAVRAMTNASVEKRVAEVIHHASALIPKLKP